jgi:hypothetical protein
LLIAVVILFFLSLFLVLVVNKLQSSRPDWLPAKLKTWNWLPVWLRSLQPYDDVIDKILNFCRTKVLRRKDDGDSDEEDLDKEDEDGEYRTSINNSTASVLLKTLNEFLSYLWRQVTSSEHQRSRQWVVIPRRCDA